MVILALLFALFILTRLYTVQTFLGRLTASYLSEELHTQVQINKIRISGILSASIEDLLVKDLHGDTLILAKEIGAGIDVRSFRDEVIHLNYLYLDSTQFNLIKYGGEDKLNLVFIIDYFAGTDKVRDSLPQTAWTIYCDDLELHGCAFHLLNEDRATQKMSMDYHDMQVQNINLSISSASLMGDTIRGLIRNLSCNEKSGLILKEFHGDCMVSSSGFHVNDLRARTNHSNLSMDLAFHYDEYPAFLDFINKVRITSDIHSSHVNMRDIGYFAEALIVMKNNLKVSGVFDGVVSDFTAKEFKFSFGKATKFYGDISIKGLPEIEKTLSDLKINYFYSNKHDVESFALPIPGIHLIMPQEFISLGDFKIVGEFTGYYNDFTSNASFYTDLGVVSTDIKVFSDTSLNAVRYRGSLETMDFDIGTFLNVEELGLLTLETEVEGKGLTAETVEMNLAGWIDSLQVNGAVYDKIIVGGQLTGYKFDGRVVVDDRLINLDFDGKIDFEPDKPVYDFVATVEKARLYEMNLSNRAKDMELTTSVRVKLEASGLNDLQGTVLLEDTRYHEDGENYSMDRLTLDAFLDPLLQDSLMLVSDFLDISLTGDFELTNTYQMVEDVIIRYIQRKGPDTARAQQKRYLDYYLSFKNTASLSKLFYPSLRLAPNTVIHGSVNISNNYIDIYGTSDEIKYAGVRFLDWDLDVRAENSEIVLQNSFSEIVFRKQAPRSDEDQSQKLGLDNFNMNMALIGDSLAWEVIWDDMAEEDMNKSNVEGYILFSGPGRVEGKITRADASVNGEKWTINRNNYFVIDSSSLSIREFDFLGEDQGMYVQGVVSENPDDELTMRFDDWRINNFDPLINNSKLDMEGIINGSFGLSNYYSNPSIISDLNVHDLVFNGDSLGEAFLKSGWSVHDSALVVDAEIYHAGNVDTSRTLKIYGYYDPYDSFQNMDFDITINNLGLHAFEPFVEVVFADINGFASGNLKLGGSLKYPELLGSVRVMRTEFKVSYVNVKYSMAHEVVFSDNEIRFENLAIYDTLGNKAIATGKILHDHFRDIALDISILPDHLLGMDLNRYQNDVVYGQAFASGEVKIYGPVNDITLEINTRSEEGTDITIPLRTSIDVSQSDFVIFLNTLEDTTISEEYLVNVKGLTLKFNLDVTPDADIQIFLPGNMGYIKANGSGKIKLGVDPRGHFTIEGKYVLERGMFHFTLEQLLSKRFQIIRGSSIAWEGDPYQADVNIRAMYRLKTTLDGLGMNLPAGSEGQRVTVNCYIILTEDLFNPNLRFSIDFPNLDNVIKQNVLAVLDTTDAALMNQQAISLLVLNSFSYTGNTTPLNVSSYSILANQLSNWLSKISNDFDIGVNYMAGDDITTEQLEVALSTQLFSNRLVIDGAFEVPTDGSQNSSNIVGDVNIEYKLTPDGRIRVKAFNRSNNLNTLEETAPYTQGVGLFWRKEFNKFSDLFNGKKEKKRKKKEEKAGEKDAIRKQQKPTG